MAATIEPFEGLNEAIKTEYIPVLNEIETSKGMKILALAHTMQEGFKKGTKAYKTNNPGNIGTSKTMGRVGRYPVFKYGTLAQINYLERIRNGAHKMYLPPSKGGGNRTGADAGNSTLKAYLYQYAPPGGGDNNRPESYIKFVIGVFRKQGYIITKDTTLNQIAKIN